jgi:hypothetical protein
MFDELCGEAIMNELRVDGLVCISGRCERG